MMRTFEDRRLVVIGDSSGMGKQTAADVVAGFNGFHPLRRVGTIHDVSCAITHLLSDDAGWVTAPASTSTVASRPGAISHRTPPPSSIGVGPR